MSQPLDQNGRTSADEGEMYLRVQRTEQFQELRRQFRRFIFPMTVVFMSWYLLYVIASGWARDFMGQEVIGNINVAYVFGLLQFVSTFLIAWLYERHMNRRVDPLADRIVDEMERGELR